jgi:hypothetical protein
MHDITSYVRVLQFIEQSGETVTLHGAKDARLGISQSTIYVLKAGVFLHLYNLVESTVSAALTRTAEEVKSSGVPFADLCDCWQRQWASRFVQFDEEPSQDTRLDYALRMCKHISDGVAIEIDPKLSGGNLDDRVIEDVAARYGISITLSPNVLKRVKREVHNDQGCLGLVKLWRNRLAHGTDSFADIGKDYAVAELATWSCTTYRYLKQLIGNFERYTLANQFRRHA